MELLANAFGRMRVLTNKVGAHVSASTEEARQAKYASVWDGEYAPRPMTDVPRPGHLGITQAIKGRNQLNIAIFTHEPTKDEPRRLAWEIEQLGHRAHILNVDDMASVGGKFKHPDYVPPHFDGAIMYHGAEGPTSGVRMLRKLQGAGTFTVNQADGMVASRDKWLTALAIKRWNAAHPDRLVPHPETLLISSPDDMRAALKQFGGEMVVKPRVGTEGKGVQKVANEQEALAAMREAEANGQQLVAQPLVDAGATDHRLTVVKNFDDTSGVHVMLRRQANPEAIAKGEIRANISAGGQGELFEATPAMKRLAIDANEALGLHTGGVDIMVDKKTGKLFVVEVNSGPGSAETYTGLNQFAPMAKLSVEGATSARAARTAAQAQVSRPTDALSAQAAYHAQSSRPPQAAS